MTRITGERAAELAIMAQLLDARRPDGIRAVVCHLIRVQMDPTAVVARTEHIARWIGTPEVEYERVPRGWRTVLA